MPKVRYRLKAGTYSMGSVIDKNLVVIRSCDKNNNIIEVDEKPGDTPLCTLEPTRYELVPDVGRFTTSPGDEYNLTYNPEVYEAEAARLTQIARLIREKEAKLNSPGPSPQQQQTAQTQQAPSTREESDSPAGQGSSRKAESRR